MQGVGLTLQSGSEKAGHAREDTVYGTHYV